MDDRPVTWAGFDALDPLIFGKSHRYSNIGIFDFPSRGYREVPRKFNDQVRLADRPMIDERYSCGTLGRIAFGCPAAAPLGKRLYLSL
jgi:hypothetical protein